MHSIAGWQGLPPATRHLPGKQCSAHAAQLAAVAVVCLCNQLAAGLQAMLVDCNHSTTKLCFLQVPSSPQDLAHTLRSRLACNSLALSSLEASYLKPLFHSPVLPTGPGPHAAQPAGGPAALWRPEACAARLCCGPLCGRSVLHHGAADGEEQGRLRGCYSIVALLMQPEVTWVLWECCAMRCMLFRTVLRLLLLSFLPAPLRAHPTLANAGLCGGGACTPARQPAHLLSLFVMLVGSRPTNERRILWWLSTHTSWVVPPSPSFGSCLPPMLRRQPLAAPPPTPLLRLQAVSCPALAKRMAR